MKKILKGIISSILISLIIFLMIPFNIHADGEIIGRNISYELIESEQKTGYAINNGIIHVELLLDDSYIGYILPNYTVQYRNYFWGASSPYWGNNQSFFQNRVFVNGTVAKFDIPIQWYSLNAGVSDQGANPVYYDTYTITSSDLSKFETDGISIIPIESYPWVELFYRNGYSPTNWNKYLNYYIPTFSMTENQQLFGGWVFANRTYYMAFFIDKSISNATIPTLFSFTGLNYSKYTTLNVFDSNVLALLEFTTSQGAEASIKALKSFKIMPLYFGYNTDILSTDFAITVGLKNSFLRNIETIANGSSASIQSASDLQQSTDLMQDQMDDMFNIESGYNEQFNNSLNDIDFTNPIQSNAGILPAANFVITVFNGLVNNPLSILIIIICILTIGKKVIGK